MLVNCTECSHEVSTKAKSCPACGAPMRNSITGELFSSYFDALRRGVDFCGRSPRKEFWLFQLVNLLLFLAIDLIPWDNERLLGMILISYSLFVIVPSLALCVRRLRDAGQTWHWLFVAWVPIAGNILLLVLFCLPTKPTEIKHSVPEVTDDPSMVGADY